MGLPGCHVILAGCLLLASGCAGGIGLAPRPDALDRDVDVVEPMDAQPWPDIWTPMPGDTTSSVEVSSRFHLQDLTAVGGIRACFAKSGLGWWAVGEEGLVLRHNGRDFLPMLVPTNHTLTAVTGVGDTLIAVGESGIVLRRSAGIWEVIDPPAAIDLHGVGALGPDDFYVAGVGGHVWHRENGAWTAMDTGISYDLFAIHASATGGIFAVGDFGTLLERKGDVWLKSQIAGSNARLRAIWRAPDGRVFVAGSRGTLLVREADGWHAQLTNDTSVPARDLYGLFGFEGDDVYAVGDRGVIVHYDGHKWLAMSVAGPRLIQADLRGVAGILQDDAPPLVAIGGLASAALTLEDGAWRDTVPGVTADLHAVSVDSDGAVVAVGSRGTVLRAKNGRIGALESGVDTDLWGVSGGIAAGVDGVILSIDDAVVERIPNPSIRTLFDVAQGNAVTWIVGQAGTLLRLSDGVVELVTADLGADLRAVTETPDQTLFVGGAAGGIWTRSNGRMVRVATPGDGGVWDLWGESGDRVLAVVDQGQVWRCDPVACEEVFRDAGQTLYAIAGRDGFGPLVAGWNGSLWEGSDAGFGRIPTGTPRALRAVAVDPVRPVAWIVGLTGTWARVE